jgi:hypothetical protein
MCTHLNIFFKTYWSRGDILPIFWRVLHSNLWDVCWVHPLLSFAMVEIVVRPREHEMKVNEAIQDETDGISRGDYENCVLDSRQQQQQQHRI